MQARRVLVTGSSRGIGRAAAERLAADGFALAVHYKESRERAERVCAGIREKGGCAELLQFDVANRSRCREVLEEDIGKHGAFYGAVLNAGITRDTPFAGLSGDDWDAVLRTDLDGFYNVLRPIIMPMISAHAGGRIVSISSLSGIAGNRGQVNYSAAKAGLIGATKALAKELAKRGITVNCVAPGLIDTDMIKGLPLEEAVNMIPMGRLGKAEEVAALVAFLFSDSAGYISAQVISVNGGML